MDNAPLNLKDLELQHAFLETSTVLAVMREHYQKECIRQLYRIVGSVEVLGNPVGLFRNLGTCHVCHKLSAPASLVYLGGRAQTCSESCMHTCVWLHAVHVSVHGKAD